MTVNSDTANKLLKNLRTEIEALLQAERDGSVYSYSPGEEPCVPEYSFRETQEKLHALQAKCLKLSHAIAYFNATTEIPEYGRTLDECIGRMSRLNEEKKRLQNLLTIPKTKRERAYGRGEADITCRNFDADEVKRDYDAVCRDLMAIQQTINMANMTKTFEVDI